MANDLQAWLNSANTKPLQAALLVVVALGLIPPTRKYAVPIGIIIICTWYWKWKRKGGTL